MSLLSQYNPLLKISVPGFDLERPSGVVVVVGPNSSGKTLFLRDIETYLSTGDKQFVVCRDLSPQRPADFNTFISDLIKRNYLRSVPGPQNFYRTYLPPLRSSTANAPPHHNQNLALDDLRRSYDEFTPVREHNKPNWFAMIGSTLVAQLSLDYRRTVPNQTPSFNYLTHVPEQPLQGLYVNSDAQERLAKETGNVFGNAAWLDISENGKLQLRTTNAKDRPPVGEMNNPLRAREYPRIEEEGDGYKSYVGICISLLIASRPVALIDEPELCLHPPQAYHMGRFIGQYADDKHVTLVATHSSHILRGILQTGKKVAVLRLTRRQRKFSGRLIAESELVNRLRNPRVRAEAMLDGLFSKGVVLVESESDREEYEAAAEAIEDYPSREVHFVPVGGTGGFAEAVQFYRSLSIPVAVIADLDCVCDTDKMGRLLELMCSDVNSREAAIKIMRDVAHGIKSCPPSVSEAEARVALESLAGVERDWNRGDDNLLRRQLGELMDRVRRISRLKEGGISSYADQPGVHKKITELLSMCADVGLFFVPVGELEDWVKHLMGDVSRSGVTKTERAMIAAGRIRETPASEGDIWRFVHDVLAYLQRRLE